MISRSDFEISRKKVEIIEKKCFFGAFCGILRPFQLKFAIIQSETFSVPNAPFYRIDRIFLHSQLSGFVYILIPDGYLVGKSHFTSF